MKNTIKSLIPAPLWNLARDTVITARHLPGVPAAYLHPWRRQSIDILAALKDKYRGERWSVRDSLNLVAEVVEV